MSAAHTPGPWVMVTDSLGNPQHIKSEKYTTVCSFLTSVWRSCEEEEIAGNARLIAAAPDLLDAAIEYLAAGQNSMYSDDSIKAMLRFGDAEKSLRAAIAKATGATT